MYFFKETALTTNIKLLGVIEPTFNSGANN